MALKKKRVLVEDNGGKAQSVFEHNLVKMGVPVLGFLLLSVVTWLFTTVMEIEERVQQNIIHIDHLHEAEEYVKYELKELEKTVTNLRVHVGRVTAH
tara:strand:- start:39 stop:329 length:291 start_codon:yes stop_codon:yes gene_type:complete